MSHARPPDTPVHPLVTSNNRHPPKASGSTTQGAGVRNAGNDPPERESITRAISVKGKCSQYKKPPTAAANATEPVRATKASKIPLSSTAPNGVPVLECTRATSPGSNLSRAIAKATRDVTTSTALAVAAVVSSAAAAVSWRPAEPRNCDAAAARGAGEVPSSFQGSTPSATNVTSR